VFSDVLIGSSLGAYKEIVADLGPSYSFKGIRYYAGGGALGADPVVTPLDVGPRVNVFPTPWPHYGHDSRLLMSIYPDLRQFLHGKLDGQIRAMIADAPPGSMLNAWHEVLSLPYKQPYLTPGNVFQMHCRMNTLCRGSNVTYGALLGGGQIPWLLHHTPPDLGYYGIDLYGNLGTRTHPRWRHPFLRWEQFRELVRAKDTRHHYPALVIGETNCPVQSLRPAWLELVASWMHDYGSQARALLTFWSGTGGLSGPWDPHDKATIHALRRICSQDGQVRAPDRPAR
jgi:hypothetical protein